MLTSSMEELNKFKINLNTASIENSTTGNNNSSSNGTTSLAKLRRANLAMTGAFLNLIPEEDPSSFVFSSISYLITLGVLRLTAVGSTANQLDNVLYMQNKEQVQEAFLELSKLLNKPGNVTIQSDVICYGNVQYPFSDQFVNDAKYSFDAEIRNIDFSKQEEAADEINEWVANKTHKLIQRIVEPDMLSANTVLALLNAIFFQGDWEKQFHDDKTQKGDFYQTPNKIQSIDFMQQESYFEYRDNDELQAQTLRMYYEGQNMSMVIHLPYEKDGFSNLLKKLRDPDVFERSFDSLNEQRVNVVVPKFDIEKELNLKELSIKYGLTKIFDHDAEFKGMLKNDKPVYVTEAIQKARIMVDEKGTKAAAVTGVVVETYALAIKPPDIRNFIADHPFIFTLMLRQDIIFCGAYLG